MTRRTGDGSSVAGRASAAEIPKNTIMMTRVRRALLVFRPYLPSMLYPLLFRLYRAYMEAFGRLASVWDRHHTLPPGVPDLPPAHLRYRVDNSTSARTFLELGERSREDIVVALAKSGKTLDSFESILDFGCGCGRTLIWFADRKDAASLYGTDIDADAVSWCRKKLDFADFTTNRPQPPLAYASETFDLVYALSVLTHFREQLQFAWLGELQRIAKPGGILLLSVHGKRYFDSLPRQYVEEIERSGFIFVNGNAYHTEEYVRRKWSTYFKVLEIIPGGLRGRQDLVVLGKAPR